MKNKLPSFEPLMDLQIVSLLLGCSVSTITRLCDRGLMPHIVVARHKRKRTIKIRPSALSAFLAGNSSRPPAGSGGANLPPPLPPLLPEIRPGVAVKGNGMQEPPFVSQGEADAQGETLSGGVYQGGTVGQEQATHEGEADAATV